MVQDSLGGLCPSFNPVLYYRGRSCGGGGGGGGGGPMLSGTGLSGSDRDDNETNLYWVSREVEVSNKVVEKFGIPHLIHSHTMSLPEDLFRMLYIVVDMP